MIILPTILFSQSQEGYFSGKKIKGFTGEVSCIGEYGLMNKDVFEQDVTYNYTLRGFSSITLLNTLPVKVRFNYSKIKLFGGLNNYFNVSIDTTALSKLSNQYDDRFLKKITLELEKLKGVEQKLTQKKYYNKSIGVNSSLNDTLSYNKYTDSLDVSTDLLLENESNIDKNIDVDDEFEVNEDLKSQANEYKDYFDDLDIDNIHSNDTIDNVIEKINDYKKILNSLEENASKYASSNKQKVNNFLQGVNKLSVGRVYPNVGEFLIQRVPLNGIQLGYNYRNFEFDIVYGKRTHVRSLTSNVVDNTVKNQKNPFNFFNFSNSQGGFNIGSLKLGYNNQKNLNVYFALLLGSGNEVLNDSILTETLYSNNVFKSNAALEIGSVFKLTEKHDITIAASKSASSSSGVDSLWSLISNDLIDFSQNAYAMKTRYSGVIDKAKINYSTSLSWLSPLYNSFGSVYMQANQIRWKSKISKPIGKKTKVKLAYQLNKGLDTFANLELHNIKLQSNFKVNRHFQFMVLYNPVLSKFKYDPFVAYYDSLSNDVELNQTELNLSHLGFLNFTIIPKYKKIYSLIGVNLSSVLLETSDNTMTYYNQLNLNYEVQFNRTFSLITYIRWYNTNSDLLEFNNQLSISETLNVNYKKLALSFTGLINYDMNFDYGLNLNVEYQFKYGISISSSFRKVAATGFNYYQTDLIEQFPYNFSLGLHYKW